MGDQGQGAGCDCRICHLAQDRAIRRQGDLRAGGEGLRWFVLSRSRSRQGETWTADVECNSLSEWADRYLERNFQAVWRLRAEEGVLKIDEDDLLSRRSKLTTVKVRQCFLSPGEARGEC